MSDLKFSYVVAGVITLTASLVLNGCKFGNYQETQYGGLDELHYYDTAPQKLDFQATIASQDRKVSAPPSFLPPILQAIMTEPVVLYHFAKSGAEYITEKTGTVGARVAIHPETSTFAWSESGTAQLIDTCKYTLSESRDGSYENYLSPAKSPEGYSVLGRLKVVHHKSYVWTGTGCPDVMVQFHACYLSVDSCWGANSDDNLALQKTVRGIFNPFIAASVMSVEEIKTTQSLAYTADFE